MTLTIDDLLQASAAGGPSTLTSMTELEPAAGPHAAVAPAKFALSKDAKRLPGLSEKAGMYAYEKRYLDGELTQAVLIDSKQSQLNRAEQAIAQAITAGHPVLSRVPRVEVTYERDGVSETYDDLSLPHRVFDGHIRAGSVDGTPTTQTALYRSLRDASPANARPLLEASPVSLVFGSWDSSRASRQGRWRSILVGEIVGFCADDLPDHPPLKGGGRTDPVGMSFEKVDRKVLAALAEQQRAELSTNLYEKVTKQTGKEKASALGLGGIAPNLETLGGVACRRIIRSHVLSFAALRQIRFGGDADADMACRALLAALALNGLARSDDELVLRANCDLREAGPSAVELDQRGGEPRRLAPLSIAAADDLLASALSRAEDVAGVRWNGVALRVTGNPTVLAGASDDDAQAS